jgi:hypothetical protein
MKNKNWFADCNTFEELTKSFNEQRKKLITAFYEENSSQKAAFSLGSLHMLIQQYIMILENNFDIREKDAN